MTLAEDISKFVKNVRFEQIPKKVVDLAKDQLLGILGAIYAGSKFPGPQIIKKTALNELYEGVNKVSIIPSGEKVSLRDAVTVNSASAIALDYDDYLFFAHTGGSTIPLPLALSECFPISGKELLTSIIIGNEVAGRIGASILIGPSNGQLWSYVHLGSSAVITARILGLNEQQIANALGTAYYVSTVAMYRGFMGPMSKLLTISTPIKAGIEAAMLAKNNFTGALDIFESPLGWCNFTADVPLPSFINSELGSAWVTETISFKMVPGCAYVSPIADCLNTIFKKEPELNYKEIEEVKIFASMLMSSMDDLSRPFTNLKELERTNSHIALNFYIPYNTAVMLIDKELTPKQFEKDRMLDPEVHELAKKVKTISDISATTDTVSLITSLGIETVEEELKIYFKKDKMEKLDMAFGAKMVIKIKDGRKLTAKVRSPIGSPANRVPIDTKLIQEAKYIGIDESQIQQIINKVRKLEEIKDVASELIPILILK